MDSHNLLHMRWIHGSAAASAKRTEIRRPHRGSRHVRPKLKIPADICTPLMKSEFRSPAALASPLTFHSVSIGLLRIRILDASGPRSSKHYANPALRELRFQILDISGPRFSIHYANHALWELRIKNLDTPGRSFSVFFCRQSINSTKFKRIDPQDDDF